MSHRPGAVALLRAAQRDDPRPLWLSIWGGANTLAEALMHARATLSPEAVDALVAKLRVYSISDQDDAGPWIRREFPRLFYIVKPSAPNGEEYASATWTGISGDVYYGNCAGADGSTVTNQWLDTHVRAKGPLGKHYPRFEFIMEGDTPAFLGLINNGLESFRNPSWGGWGGRYLYSPALWRKSRHLDAGRRCLRARHLAGRCLWQGRQALPVGPGHHLALAYGVSARFRRAHGLDRQGILRGESRTERGGEWHRRNSAAARRCASRPAAGIRRGRQQ